MQLKLLQNIMIYLLVRYKVSFATAANYTGRLWCLSTVCHIS